MGFIIYGKPSCPFCERAKSLLESKGVDYSYVDVSEDESARKMLVKNNFRTVPQIYEGDTHIGGFTDLREHLLVTKA